MSASFTDLPPLTVACLAVGTRAPDERANERHPRHRGGEEAGPAAPPDRDRENALKAEIRRLRAEIDAAPVASPMRCRRRAWASSKPHAPAYRDDDTVPEWTTPATLCGFRLDEEVTIARARSGRRAPFGRVPVHERALRHDPPSVSALGRVRGRPAATAHRSRHRPGPRLSLGEWDSRLVIQRHPPGHDRSRLRRGAADRLHARRRRRTRRHAPTPRRSVSACSGNGSEPRMNGSGCGPSSFAAHAWPSSTPPVPGKKRSTSRDSSARRRRFGQAC